jgi:parallel beta-helix repeat protein
MNQRTICKGLAFAVIVLFLGTCITPTVAIDNVKKSSIPISSGNTLYVGGSGPGNYTKIQDAIDNASDGDIVFVFNGIYYENILIFNSINLIGENRYNTIIDGEYKGSVIIKIFANYVTIKNFTIQNTTKWGGLGILIYSNFTVIISNFITNNGKGLALVGTCCKTTIKNNIICSNQQGIFFHYSINNNIIGNNIANNSEGISFFNSRNNIILKNNLINNSRNIYINFEIYCINETILCNNTWSQNYWNRVRILPKIIFQVIELRPFWFPSNWLKYGYFIPIPVLNFDWQPSKEPYIT